MNEQEKAKALAQSEYFLVATARITGDMMKKATRLRMVQKTGVGCDNIDIKTAAELNIPVCNTPGGNSTAVAELTIAFILNLYRKLNILDRATKNGKWYMWEYRLQSFEMKGKTHGIIGMGNIGKATARLSQAFGTKIIYYDKYRLKEDEEKALNVTYMEMDDLLKNSDIVSIHIPLLPETEGLIGERELALMKKNAILINVSRGKIVDEKALAKALKEKRISGAGIDTWANEPVDKDNPLLKFDNVIATPHIGAGTRDTLSNILEMCFKNFSIVESGGDPQYVVNGIMKARK
jgi:lactate dehydrogenase-like 2-hydroxyacid dehydrogenase